MKKIFLTIAVLGLLSATACSGNSEKKENTDTTANADNGNVPAVAIDEVEETETDTIPTAQGNEVVTTTTDVAEATDLQ